LKLHDLQPSPGSHKRPRRVGRGHGSGRGKTAGRGTKGQKSRAGGGIPAWFEGGQTPLHVRTPKLHGFRNRNRVEYAPINLARLTDAPAGTLITPAVLEHDGLVRDSSKPVKILGVGEAPSGVTIHAHAFSQSALNKLAAAGSTVQRISWPDGEPVEDEPEGEVEAIVETPVVEDTEPDSEPEAVTDEPAEAPVKDGGATEDAS